MKTRPLGILAIVVLAYALSGCSVSFSSGGSTVDQSDEVTNAKNYISQQLTALPPTKTVSCPSGVSSDVGTTFTCTATLTNGQRIVIPLRVSSSSGSSGRMTSNPKVVNQSLAIDLLYQAAKSPIKSADCPTGLKLKVGTTFKCTAKLATGETDEVLVKVAAVAPNGLQHLVIAGARKV